MGGSLKAGSGVKTGRFGVGFCSVYHLTDLPSFLSRQFVVVLDPHCAHLPAASAAEPGKLIDFTQLDVRSPPIAAQLAPYAHLFGSGALDAPFSGTLFRLPLRTAAQAASSRISPRAYDAGAAAELLAQFARDAPTVGLFLTHVRSLRASIWREGAATAVPIAACELRDDVSGGGLGSHPLYRALGGGGGGSGGGGAAGGAGGLDVRQLPEETAVARVRVLSRARDVAGGGARTDRWLLVQAMGGGRARALCVDAEALAYRLVLLPWAGVCARLGGGAAGGAVPGLAYCQLPLPTRTGLPVHVNAFFELSTNRRDIWHGSDMAGAGALRARWNEALLADVVAPAYARLLVEAERLLRADDAPIASARADCAGGTAAADGGYYALWPTHVPPQPWGLVVTALYALLLPLPVVRVYASVAADAGADARVRRASADGGGDAGAAAGGDAALPKAISPRAAWWLDEALLEPRAHPAGTALATDAQGAAALLLSLIHI